MNTHNNTSPQEALRERLHEIISRRLFEKLTLSRYGDKTIRRVCGHLFEKDGKPFLQLETFTSDGKALHRNIPLAEAADALCEEFPEKCRQLNLTGPSGGELEAMCAASGRLSVRDRMGNGEAPAVRILPHNRQKQYILREGVPYDFLIRLGISDPSGRIYDKKQSKFRQINKFLENVAAVYDSLPKTGCLHVLDLCCGKSYLTFAVYYYLTALRGREVRMLGADRKEDVIRFCRDTARELFPDGLDFVCCDITAFEVPFHPELVLSLHACDIATDIVLAKAIETGADVILSTPCCHHELMGQLSAHPDSQLSRMLAPVTSHSLLRQKLCDALTDGLRCRYLAAEGYDVTVTELIDPEETPKNLMIRAVRGRKDQEKSVRLLAEYDEICRLAGIDPALRRFAAKQP